MPVATRWGGLGRSRVLAMGLLSGGADLNQNLPGNLGVRGERECLVDVLKRQYVSDHLLDLRVLIKQGDGGVDFGVEAERAAQLDFLRHQGRQVDRSSHIGQVADLDQIPT